MDQVLALIREKIRILKKARDSFATLEESSNSLIALDASIEAYEDVLSMFSER